MYFWTKQKTNVSFRNVPFFFTADLLKMLAAEPFHLLSPGFSRPLFVLKLYQTDKHIILLSFSFHLGQFVQSIPRAKL